jgi:hypothetical protein
MQGGNQILRSDQKRLDKIRCFREAIATGKPVLADQEKIKIINHATVLGEDEEAVVEELLVRVRESSSQPADVMRMIKDYISELGKRAALP